jgi:ATP-binding cassette subfamily C protein LapB
MPVRERGDSLSGGQRQAITIARAVIKRPPILILDEPTSAMDARTERAFIERFRQENLQTTMILITHRSSLLQLVDRVILIDDGRCMASKTVAEF